MDNTLKVCTLSDLHGTLLPLEEFQPCDLVCICGDLSPLKMQTSHKKMRRWLMNKFLPWAHSLPCDKVLFIAGNHDGTFDDIEFMKTVFDKDKKVTYLFHESYPYKGFTIFGTPYCKVFGNWAFMEIDEILRNLYEQIPNNVDILMTHDAPYGTSDVLLQPGYYTGEHIGNMPLAEAIIKKAPSYVLHGHLHSTSHEFEEWGGAKIINCSIKDEHYEPIYDPIYFEICK